MSTPTHYALGAIALICIVGGGVLLLRWFLYRRMLTNVVKDVTQFTGELKKRRLKVEALRRTIKEADKAVDSRNWVDVTRILPTILAEMPVLRFTADERARIAYFRELQLALRGSKWEAMRAVRALSQSRKPAAPPRAFEFHS